MAREIGSKKRGKTLTGNCRPDINEITKSDTSMSVLGSLINSTNAANANPNP